MMAHVYVDEAGTVVGVEISDDEGSSESVEFETHAARDEGDEL